MFGNSLSNRLLAMVTLLLLVFFGITIVVLDSVFRESSEQAIRDRLDIQSLVLMAAAEEQIDNRLAPSAALLDTRYLSPNSGLYGQISNSAGEVFWTSRSLLGAELPFIGGVAPGRREFGQRTMSNGARVLTLSVGLSWQFIDGQAQDIIYSVAENMEQYYEQLRLFRVRLFGGFAVMSLLLVVAFALLFRNVLKPLRQVEHEIEAIEAGQLAELGNHYPRELMGVTQNMNMLLRSERERMSRYRNTLGNLAHSLKTPLAVIRNLLSGAELREHPAARQLDEQVGRMDDIVRYQLKRAAASAGLTLGIAPVKLQEVVGPLEKTLQKVYFDRHISCFLDIDPECTFLAEKGDLMELAGNLLDNAFKYCRGRVLVTIRSMPVMESRRHGVQLIIEDDGPGISPDKRQHVLERGTRLDERASGQGIGLSVVRELAGLYRGSVEISASSLGGARISVQLLGA